MFVKVIALALTSLTVSTMVIKPSDFPSEFIISTFFYPFASPFKGSIPFPKQSSFIKSLSYIAKVILFSFGSA